MTEVPQDDPAPDRLAHDFDGRGDVRNVGFGRRLSRALHYPLVNFQIRIERVLRWHSVFLFAILASTAFVAYLRIVPSLAFQSAGGDYGHYLIGANWYSGQDRSGEGPFDPPLVPLVIVALTPFLGRIGTLQVLGPLAAASLVPAATYLLARFVPRSVALLAASVFALWQTFTDLITYGGVTNLLGISLSLVFFRIFFGALELPRVGLLPSKIDFAAAGLAALVVSTHHVTAFVTGATVLVWVATRLLQDRQRRRAIAWTALRTGCLSAVLSLVYLPYLLGLLMSDISAGLGLRLTASGILDVIALVWRFTPQLWIAFVVLDVLVFARFLPGSTFASFAFALLSTPMILFLTALASHPMRTLFFEQFPIIFLACCWLMKDPSYFRPRPLPGVALRIAQASCIVLLLVSFPILLATVGEIESAGMTVTHRFLKPGTFQAFDWIAKNTPVDATVAVDGGSAFEYNERWKGLALGWWLEGYANRRAIYTANPALVPFQAKWPDVRDANRMFAGDTVFEDGMLRVADSFPDDDGSVPMISSGYFGDYHEFAGFAVPRLVNTSGGSSLPLVLGSASSVSRVFNATRAAVLGMVSGLGYNGTRSMVFDATRHSVSLEFTLTLDSDVPWDALELSLRFSARVAVNLSHLADGTITFGFASSFGFEGEQGILQFATTNGSRPQLIPGVVEPEEQVLGIRWPRTGTTIVLHIEVTMTRMPFRAGPTHPIEMWTIESILATHAISFIFLSTDSQANIRRFERQPERYLKTFGNDGSVIFYVMGLSLRQSCSSHQ